MLKRYLITAWRKLLRDRQFTILNLIGLSTGLACTFLIFLWVSDERSVNRFNDNDSRLYQVMLNIPLAGGIQTQEYTPGLLGRALKNELPEVEYAVSVKQGYQEGIISTGSRHIKAMPKYVDSDFFKLFSYPIIEGNRASVLSDKNALLISDDLAKKLFNTSSDVVGKELQLEDDTARYKVSGVFSIPQNAKDKPDLLLTYQSYFDKHLSNLQNWQNSSPFTYVLLKEGTDIDQLNQKLFHFIESKDHKATATLFTRRFSDSYLFDKYQNGKQAGGRIEYVKLFSFIAMFILIIACINFMNLSTAKAAYRVKDAGIKKIMGASRRGLVFQYLTESVLLTFVSFLLAFGLVILFLPQFNSITQKHLIIHYNASLLLTVLCICLLTGAMAGSYPALYISGFKPVNVLKGKLKTSLNELWVRKGLVVVQFALSAVFIVSVLVVYQQMNFIQSKNLGYNKDGVIAFKNEGALHKNLQSFLNEVKKIPGVTNASSFRGDLTGNHGATENVVWEGKLPDQLIQFAGLDVDYGLMEMLDFKMAEGRTFSKEFGADSLKIIFNERAIAAMGIENPVGKTVQVWGKPYQIIGVAKDFHFESLYKKVEPCFMRCYPSGNNVLVKIGAGKEKDALAGIAALYKSLNSDQIFEYSFLDDTTRALYFSEQRIATLSRYFAGLAIIISCLGLFGLVAFTAQKRQKEIGIRKVVGAMATDIVIMLSKDFLKLVFVAILIALPVAWWITYRWLENFAYHIPISFSIFFLTGGFIMLITLFTISFQAIKAAVINPIISLRTE